MTAASPFSLLPASLFKLTAINVEDKGGRRLGQRL